MSHADAPTLRPEDVTIPEGHGLRRLPMIALGVGALVLIVSLTQFGKPQFYFSWLVAFMFWLSIALGALFFVLTHYATRARWSVVLRRVSENFMFPLVGFFVLFIPVLAGRHELFHWMHADVVAHDPLLQSKQWWLNESFWLLRVAIYFVAWAGMAWWFRSRSLRQDHEAPDVTKRLIRLSAPALILFALTTTLASVDWIMSLDPHWYSTMFGVYYFSGALVGFFALFCIFTVRLRRQGVLGGAVTVEHQHDLGKLLFAFTVFWAYIAFSQYFLIWYSNIPEETVFYLHRAEAGWGKLTTLLAGGHFLVPFFFLMSRYIKRRDMLLVAGALWMFVMHFLDLYWLIMPTLHKHDVHLSWLDFTTFIGMGGLFMAAAGYLMSRGPLVPLNDPRIEASLLFENV